MSQWWLYLLPGVFLCICRLIDRLQQAHLIKFVVRRHGSEGLRDLGKVFRVSSPDWRLLGRRDPDCSP